jgi:hypothetical protein
MDHTEYFYNLTDSVLIRQLARASRYALRAADLDSPAYFSIGTEFRQLLRSGPLKTGDNGTKSITSEDTGLTRVDIAPQALSVQEVGVVHRQHFTVGWRETYYWQLQSRPTIPGCRRSRSSTSA